MGFQLIQLAVLHGTPDRGSRSSVSGRILSCAMRKGRRGLNDKSETRNIFK
jgi:hypothetical protein